MQSMGPCKSSLEGVAGLVHPPDPDHCAVRCRGNRECGRAARSSPGACLAHDDSQLVGCRGGVVLGWGMAGEQAYGQHLRRRAPSPGRCRGPIRRLRLTTHRSPGRSPAPSALEDHFRSGRPANCVPPGRRGLRRDPGMYIRGESRPQRGTFGGLRPGLRLLEAVRRQ